MDADTNTFNQMQMDADTNTFTQMQKSPDASVWVKVLEPDSFTWVKGLETRKPPSLSAGGRRVGGRPPVGLTPLRACTPRRRPSRQST
jgi:hypothetical protein